NIGCNADGGTGKQASPRGAREHRARVPAAHPASDQRRRRRAARARPHPAFYGSYDWHSAVHMHWLLMRVLRLYPVSQMAPRIADALDAHLTPDAVARELDYFNGSAGRTFERPYGWAWLLELQAEALATKSRWSRALAPLATELARRFAAYVSASPYPIRAGAHGNTAFACVL